MSGRDQVESAIQGLPTDENKVPKLWKFGDPYKFPISKLEGDPYEKILAPFLERDRNQCKAWTDEVQNLLIFAGLFSGVVTAYVIESYKGLQQDPNTTAVVLLLRMADRLDALAMNSSLVTVCFHE